MATSPLIWSADGQPRSAIFDDVYFSAEDGLAEARAVFLKGCGLPDAWAGRREFVVGELGFGSGLNILALLDLWTRTSDPAAHVHIFSIEAYPLTREEAARVLAAWPQLAPLAEALLAVWPGRARGFHRVDLPGLRATLDLAVMEAAPALENWNGKADAWFLDGFSPALNPDMWSPQVLAAVARASAPGARLGTFTVAGAVRRGLSAQGFEVAKVPGHGRKRERLEARLPGHRVARPGLRVAVIGGGIGGASAMRALKVVGQGAVHFEADTLGAGASGNRAALVTPRWDAGLGPLTSLFAQGHYRATCLYEGLPEAILGRGAVQTAQGPRDAGRFVTLAGSDLFEAGDLKVAGEPPCLNLASALAVEPAVILAAWTECPSQVRVMRLAHGRDGWSLFGEANKFLGVFDRVILATGADQLWPAPETLPVRGQASWTDQVQTDHAVVWGGYGIPTREGLLFGATYNRGDTGVEVRAEDHRRNLASLAVGQPQWAAAIDPETLGGRASIRATTTDYLPLAGPVAGVPDGIHVLGGFGSRGFSLAPLLAEHVVALALDLPSPLPRNLAALVAPQRFADRAARRGG